MAQFNFIVIHKKGSGNINADALSRVNPLDDTTAEENAKYQIDNEEGELKITFAIYLG